MKLLFIIYMCVLVYVVFFAEAMGRTPQDGYVYNLTPLKEIKRFMKYIWDNDALGRAARLNIFGNIIAFIPLEYICHIHRNQSLDSYRRFYIHSVCH